MLEVLRQAYIRTARAKGLTESRVIIRHGFRNVLIPVMTLFGLLLPAIIGGSVILEVMFNWPGMGRLFFESMMSRDYPTIMALTFVTACLVLLGTLLADLSYPLVDPRITYD
jgi:peptide/nickel transport system permease protein